MCIRLSYYFNHLELEVSAQCILQTTGDLNGCPLLCLFLVDDFKCIFKFFQYHSVHRLQSTFGAKGLIVHSKSNENSNRVLRYLKSHMKVSAM
jgi:hypothetical protein